MRYMQIKVGQKLHLVYEAGEGKSHDKLISAGYLSHPLCGRKANNKNYSNGFRLIINFPMGHGCLNCLRVYNARHRKIIKKAK